LLRGALAEQTSSLRQGSRETGTTGSILPATCDAVLKGSAVYWRLGLQKYDLSEGCSMLGKLKRARQQATWDFFIFVCWQISVWVPKDRWYQTSLNIVRLIDSCAGWIAPKQLNASEASLVPRLLHRFLDQLAGRDAFFPIPLIVEGEEHLRQYIEQPGGFVIATAHIPFLKMLMPTVTRMTEGKRTLRVVAKYPEGDEKNSMPAWNDKPWSCLRADQTLLLHTRSLLRQEGILFVAVDREQGDVISANIFRFVGKMNSRVITSFTELQPNGNILLRLMIPPKPRCKSDDDIEANLAFVAANVTRILQGKKAAKVAKPVLVEADHDDSERSRELHRVRLYSAGQLQARMKSLESLLEDHADAVAHRSQVEQKLALLRHEFQNRA
jgi:hypothetical protein